MKLWTQTVEPAPTAEERGAVANLHVVMRRDGWEVRLWRALAGGSEGSVGRVVDGVPVVWGLRADTLEEADWMATTAVETAGGGE